MNETSSIGNDDQWPIAPPGIWLEARSKPAATPQPGLFLDRDGVIIVDKRFVSAPGDVEFVPGAAELISEANRCAVPVTIVTNQSGIGRQLLGWAEFVVIEREITRRLAAAGTRLDSVLACPFHPGFTASYGVVDSHWRKPGPGLVLAAARLLNIEIGMSWLGGDQSGHDEAASPPHTSERTDPGAGCWSPVAANAVESLAILKDAELLDYHGFRGGPSPS